LKKENIGWMAGHLMEGNFFLSYCSFLRKDGSLRLAAEYVKQKILQDNGAIN